MYHQHFQNLMIIYNDINKFLKVNLCINIPQTGKADYNADDVSRFKNIQMLILGLDMKHVSHIAFNEQYWLLVKRGKLSKIM